MARIPCTSPMTPTEGDMGSGFTLGIWRRRHSQHSPARGWRSKKVGHGVVPTRKGRRWRSSRRSSGSLCGAVLMWGGCSDEDMTPMHMTMFGAWYGGVGGQQGCPKSRRRPEDNSVRVPEVEAQSNSSSSLPRPLGPVCLKLVT